MSSDYSLRIDFDRNHPAPERVFHSMGLLVEGFDQLHTAILLGFGKEIEFNSSLANTREGSLIADISHKVKDTVRNISFEKICDAIYHSTEKEIARVKKVDSEEDVRRFADKLYSSISSRNADLESFTCSAEINLYEIADALHKINLAVEKLSDEDNAQFGKENKFVDINKGFSCPRTASQIFETSKTSLPSREVVIIRRASHVEGLYWDLESHRRKIKKFSAKMSDDNWFERWKNHDKNAQLWPGDAILADIQVTIKTSYNKSPSYENEIVKVVKVIPQDQIEQTELELN